MSKTLLLNAITSVVLLTRGDLGVNDGNWKEIPIPTVLRRIQPPPVETEIFPPEPDRRRIPPPTKPPSQLPPPGDLELHISITSKVSDHGRIGLIYNTSCSIANANPDDYAIPPLVIKIARKSKTEDITWEASFYDEMECLQGSAIPRCYGFFQTGPLDAFGAETMSILVLEKLGDRLPLGKGVMSFPPNAEQDLDDIAFDLGELGIHHGDFRWENILFAPNPHVLPGCLPSLPSPFTHQTYALRLVDFDVASKTNETTGMFRGSYKFYIERIFMNVPWGYLVQPWE